MSPAILLGVAGVSGAAMVLAAWLMLRVSGKDVLLASRVNAAQGRWARADSALQSGRRPALAPAHAALTGVGRAVLQSGLLRGRTRTELRQTLHACGFGNANAVALFLGAKMMLMLTLPVAGWFAADALDVQDTTRLMITAGGFIAGLLAPETIIKRMRKAYLGRLEAGLPDALDLLVICAQAGLSLEPAIARVAAEMRLARPEVALELEQTVRELEVMADAQVALNNLAQRTGLPTLQRLTATLVQTLQYGTPLGDALRTLSAEVRQQALTRFEAGAARLSVLLTLPMMLFILPCVFIVVGGPAVIQVMKSFGN